MPLLKGKRAKSEKGVSANISRCAHEGKRPHKQCIAIAMNLAGKSKKKKSTKSTRRKK